MARSIRDVYGDLLVQMGQENEQIVVLDADVSSSTKSGAFGKAYPDRFFNVGIAEANMVAMAAGLATTGKIPFANTFAVFITSIGLISARAFGSYSKLNIKLMGAYCGLSDSFDGPSHHAIEDLAIMRALPNFEVLVATDEVQTEWLIRYAAAKEGPMYIRLSRDATLPVYQSGTMFEPGKGKVVREGSDACVLACGGMVGYALEAAKRLASRGISIRVVDLFSIKPLDNDLILRSAAQTGAIVTAEEHNVHGGLGSAVAEVLASGRSGVPVKFVGIRDTHAESGPYADLLRKYGLDVTSIEHAVEAVVQAKNKP